MGEYSFYDTSSEDELTIAIQKLRMAIDALQNIKSIGDQYHDYPLDGLIRMRAIAATSLSNITK